MTADMCPGCGREIAGEPIACPGCGRSLSQGTAVPPGWGVSATATATVAAPRWRLAGIETARRPEGPEDTIPAAPAELFRPPPSAAGDTVEMESMNPGGAGWRVRTQSPRRLSWTPAVAAAAATASRTASRLIYWALVGGILATSSAAVLLLAVHMARGR